MPNDNDPRTVSFAEIAGGKLDIIQQSQYFSVNIQHITNMEVNNPVDGTKLALPCPLNGEFGAATVYSPYTPEVEHIWPRAMGGISDDSNLALACAQCNEDKRDFINASDFHYEEICLTNWDETSDEFAKELKRDYKLALWNKANFKCELCGSTAKDLGQLEFVRKNPNDSWHFLNISILCPSCTHKITKHSKR